MRVPEEPAFTCPTIDEVKGIIDEAKTVLEETLQTGWADMESTDAAITDLAAALCALEDLRQLNTELRRWGQYWKDEATQRQEQLEAAEAEVQNLETELEPFLNT